MYLLILFQKFLCSNESTIIFIDFNAFDDESKNITNIKAELSWIYRKMLDDEFRENENKISLNDLKIDTIEFLEQIFLRCNKAYSDCITYLQEQLNDASFQSPVTLSSTDPEFIELSNRLKELFIFDLKDMYSPIKNVYRRFFDREFDYVFQYFYDYISNKILNALKIKVKKNYVQICKALRFRSIIDYRIANELESKMRLKNQYKNVVYCSINTSQLSIESYLLNKINEINEKIKSENKPRVEIYLFNILNTPVRNYDFLAIKRFEMEEKMVCGCFNNEKYKLDDKILFTCFDDKENENVSETLKDKKRLEWDLFRMTNYDKYLISVVILDKISKNLILNQNNENSNDIYTLYWTLINEHEIYQYHHRLIHNKNTV